jgi:class 3 adenylate cyclase
VLATALAVTAGVGAALADDPRLLRGSAVLGLAAALLPSLVLRPMDRDQGQLRELFALQQEVTRLRADVAAFAALPRPHAPETVVATYSLPLVQAALSGEQPAPAEEPAGATVIDLTERSAHFAS